MACGIPAVCYPYGKPSNGENPYAFFNYIKKLLKKKITSN